MRVGRTEIQRKGRKGFAEVAKGLRCIDQSQIVNRSIANSTNYPLSIVNRKSINCKYAFFFASLASASALFALRDVATAHPCSHRYAAHFVRGISRRRGRMDTMLYSVRRRGRTPVATATRLAIARGICRHSCFRAIHYQSETPTPAHVPKEKRFHNRFH